jgi:peroxiredoxin
MAATSNHIELGSPAPHFELPDAQGHVVRLQEAAGAAGTLVIFICNHCPYVIHMRAALQQYALDYAARGIRVIAINPNDPVAYPQETAAQIGLVAKNLVFPYLIDADQDVAALFRAACTPDPYLYDGQLRLYYHGQFDGTRPGGPAASGCDLRAATDRLLAGLPSTDASPGSIGCSIKWKPGRPIPR